MRKLLAVALLGLLVIAACTKRRTSPLAPQPSAPTTTTVRMVAGNQFVPRDTTVSRGDTLLWINMGPAQHTSTSGTCAPCAADGMWNSGLMAPGATFRVVFSPGIDQPGLVHVDTTGLIPYYCIPHQPNMAGSITVTP